MPWHQWQQDGRRPPRRTTGLVPGTHRSSDAEILEHPIVHCADALLIVDSQGRRGMSARRGAKCGVKGVQRPDHEGIVPSCESPQVIGISPPIVRDRACVLVGDRSRSALAKQPCGVSAMVCLQNSGRRVLQPERLFRRLCSR